MMPTPPDGPCHEPVREELSRRLTELAFHARRNVVVALKPRLDLSDDTCAVPDILLRPAAIKSRDLRGRDAMLVMEIADRRPGCDLEAKARLYAAHGVPEY